MLEVGLANAVALASQLLSAGYNTLRNGTQTHQLAVKPNIATLTGEFRLGTVAATTRGLLSADFRRVGRHYPSCPEHCEVLGSDY